jgi:hypothetical protein
MHQFRRSNNLPFFQRGFFLTEWLFGGGKLLVCLRLGCIALIVLAVRPIVPVLLQVKQMQAVLLQISQMTAVTSAESPGTVIRIAKEELTRVGLATDDQDIDVEGKGANVSIRIAYVAKFSVMPKTSLLFEFNFDQATPLRLALIGRNQWSGDQS